MNLNDATFFSEYRNQFGSLDQATVDHLNELLTAIKADTQIRYVSHVSYVLATIKHESAGTYAPIAEYGHGKGRAYGKADSKTGKVYYGRGYVQVTWKANYQKLGDAWNKLHPDEPLDFVNYPDLLLMSRYAWFATVYGMTTGLYTGKKLSDYGDPTGAAQFRPMRRIINGLDKADTIAGYAVKWLAILKAAVVT